MSAPGQTPDEPDGQPDGQAPARLRRPCEPIMELDAEALWVAVDARLGQRRRRGEPGPPMAQDVAAQLGFSPSTFTRLKQAALHGENTRPSLEVYLSICAWLRVSPARFARAREQRSSTP